MTEESTNQEIRIVKTGKIDRHAVAMTRRARALQYRLEGNTYADIAAMTGYKDASGAWKAVQAALKAAIHEPAELLRTIELERLDRMLEMLWPKMEAGDLRAVDRILKVMERRARLLGLDMPVKTEVTGEPVEIVIRYVDM